MPLSVISKGKPLALPPSLPAGINHPGIERVWTSAQNDLVTLQPGTPHVVAEQSDHYVQMHRPDLVIARIRRVLDPTRR